MISDRWNLDAPCQEDRVANEKLENLGTTNPVRNHTSRNNENLRFNTMLVIQILKDRYALRPHR